MVNELELSDESVIELLDQLHAEHKSGDKQSLWQGIVLCATQQAVMSDWIVDELVKIDDEIRSGHMKDFNEAFKVSIVNRAARGRAYRTDKNFMRVMLLVKEAKRRGVGIDDNMFEQIGEELNCSLRQVRDYYNRARQIEAMVKSKTKGRATTSEITDEMWDELDPNKFTIARRRGRTSY